MSKYLILILLAFTPLALEQPVASQTATKTAVQEPKVELKFNESDNVTTANLKPILLTGTDSNKVELETFAFFRGQTPTEQPSDINISFHSGSRKEQFATNRELVFVLDSERQSLGVMRRIRRACTKTPPSGLGCSYWDEILDIFLPPETLARIIRAKKVDIVVGLRNFSLKDADLEILRDFMRQISPREEKSNGGPTRWT
jgi:hypothetical protein